MNIEELELKYNYRFPKLFTRLWNDGMLDWMNGHAESFKINESWAKTIYPEIKDNPPILLHTGGFDFEMLRSEEILNFQFDEFLDIEKHKFIPFAKSEDGDIFAFYEGIDHDGENVVVCIWNDLNETEVLAKNFEDFIFRKMIEAIFDVDKDDLKGDYKEKSFKGYKEDILLDLKSITPYLKDEYIETLQELYGRDKIIESMFSFGLIDKNELNEIVEKYLIFDEFNSVFEYEIG